jgi:hypothetical protein
LTVYANAAFAQRQTICIPHLSRRLDQARNIDFLTFVCAIDTYLANSYSIGTEIENISYILTVYENAAFAHSHRQTVCIPHLSWRLDQARNIDFLTFVCAIDTYLAKIYEFYTVILNCMS